MIYNDFAEIGNIFKRAVKKTYPNKIEKRFYETLIATLKSDKKEPLIMEIPLDGRPLEKPMLATQKTLYNCGILKTVTGSGEKFLLGDKIGNLAKNLPKTIKQYKECFKNDNFYQVINKKLRLTPEDDPLTREEFLEFKNLIESISEEEVTKKAQELEALKGEVAYGYVTINGVPLTTMKFYKYYAVFKFYEGGENNKIPARLGICSLCGEKKMVTAEYTKQCRDIKYFTTTDQQYASGLTDFNKRFSICEDCLEKLLFFENNFELFNAGKIANCDSIAYPTFVFFEDVTPEDYMEFATLTKKAVQLLEKKDVDAMRLVAQDIRDKSEKGNPYAINIILYEGVNSSRKIKAVWQEIEPLRIAEIFAVGEDMSKNAYNYYSKFGDGFRKPEEWVISIQDFKTLFQNVTFGKNQKNSWKDYRDLIGAILQNRTYSRQKIINLMAENLYKTIKKGSYWRNLPFKYMLMLNFLKEIGTIKERSGDMEKLYHQIIERSKAEQDNTDVVLLAKFLEEQNIKTDEKVAAVVTGYLAEKVSYFQRKKGNKGLVDKFSGKELSLMKLKKLFADMLEKANIYGGVSQLNSFLVSLLSSYIAQMEELKTHPREMYLLFLAGVAYNLDSIKARTKQAA